MISKVAFYELGDVELQSGEVLRRAQISYATYGELNAARDNVVVLPTCYAGTHEDNQCLFGAGRAIDPAKHFIVVPSLFGNGLSSSPSAATVGQQRGRFPRTTLFDAVGCQHRLLTEELHIDRIRLVAGYSMGGCQAFEFGAQFPSFVDSILPCASTAKTSIHNDVFLRSMEAVLRSDPDFDVGEYSSPPTRGLSAFGRAWCPWAYSPAFFNNRSYQKLGFSSSAELMDYWAIMHASLDANDLLHQLDTWRNADIAANSTYGGVITAALSAISARTIVIPIATDTYFRVEDSERDVASMQNAELRTLDSEWGHSAGIRGNDPRFIEVFDKAARDLLSHA